MDLQKTGLFIATLRKVKKLTQKDLAEKIGVTDKAISRWETGKGFPDVTILSSLSEVLNVSITEIVNGEKSSSEDIIKNMDNAIIDVLSYSQRMSKKIIGTLILLIGICITILPMIFASSGGFLAVSIWGITVSIVGIVVLSYNAVSAKTTKLSKHTASILSLSVLIAALVLEALPFGVVLVLATGPNQRIIETFSYFSLTPFGYAHFFPLFTAALTVIVGVLSIIILIKRLKFERLKNIVFICTIIALVCSVISTILFGLEYMSITGVGISILLLMSVVFQAFANRA